MRDTAVFYRTWFDAAIDLSLLEFRDLILSIADFAFFGEGVHAYSGGYESLSSVAKAIYKLACPVIKKNKEKWEARLAQAGRPRLNVTEEEASKAVEIAGSVKGAAQLLGVSVSTVQRRKNVSKCQNVKNVHVNANVNKYVFDTSKKPLEKASGGAAAGQGQPFKGVAPPAPAPAGDKPWAEFESEEAQKAIEAMFDNVKSYFAKKEEAKKEEEPAIKKEEEPAIEEKAHEEQPQSPAELPAFIYCLSEEATAKADIAESDTAYNVYAGAAQAYRASSELVNAANIDECKKQMVWRKHKAFERRGNVALPLNERNTADGEYRAYSTVLDLLYTTPKECPLGYVEATSPPLRAVN